MRASGAVLVACAALLLPGAAQAFPPALTLTPAATGLNAPVYVASTPADASALYVVERGGTIQRVVGGVTDPQPFLDISKLVGTKEDQSLQSVLFSPTYASDRLFYVDYAAKNGAITVAQYEARPGKTPKRKRTLLQVTHNKIANHNGGQIAWGPNGELWVGLGDDGCCGDPFRDGQNPRKKLGKLLRATGPKFSNWKIIGYGLRNPWRFSFDSANGDLYLADVGQDAWEEIDYRAAADLGTPANYGWSRYEGTHDYNTGVPLNPPESPAIPLVDPVYEYPHGLDDCAVMGGYVYHGALMPSEVGRYFFADLCSGEIRTFLMAGGVATDERYEGLTIDHPTGFGLDAAGELYVVSISEGKVYRLSE